MPVTEFSRLTLKPGLNEAQTTLAKKTLSRARKLMQDFTTYPFYIFQETENPAHIYIVGQWASIDQHMNAWIPSAENQSPLKDLESLVEIDFMFHFDVDVGSVPPVKHAPMFSVGRHVMESGKRAGFEQTFGKRKGALEGYALGVVGGGWRIEKEEGREEFVLFVPWRYVSSPLCS